MTQRNPRKPKWTIESLKEAIEKKATELLADRLENMEEIVDEFIKEQLSKIISAALGLRYAYGRWEVQRHEKNPITELIQDLAKKKAEVWVDAWAVETLQDAKFPKGWKSEFRETYDDLLDYAVRERLKDIAEAKAAHQAQLLADMMTEEVLREEKARLYEAEMKRARGRD